MDTNHTTEERVKNAKDVAIAFLSTSALLLTLILAFIQRSVAPTSGTVRGLIQAGTVGLYITIILAAAILAVIGTNTPQEVINKYWWQLNLIFYFLLVFFGFGLGGIFFAVFYSI